MPVPQPQYFDKSMVNLIPKLPGLYAFFVDYRYVVRSIAPRPPGPVNLQDLLAKAVRANICGNPPDLCLKVTKMTAFGSNFAVRATHAIAVQDKAPQLQKPNASELAKVLAKCSLLARPVYVGITETQTLYDRYLQHRRKYRRLKKNTAGKTLPKDRLQYERGGKLFHRLVRRKVEFRDLIFACVPLSAAEIIYADYVEKVLHAVASPPLSENH